MSILVSPEYTTKVIKQNNTLREITIENYKNRSVNEAINYVINEAKQQLETTDTRIVTNKIIELLQSIPQTNTTSKSNTILYPILLKHNSILINFIEQVKTDYEDILSRSHTEFTQDVINEITNLTNIEFDRECLTDINNPKFTNCETWLSKRCALYNPSVNFEHVMFIVDIMLNGYAQSTEVLLPFYFFLKLWIDERQTMKFLIYHFMKLIRVYILSKYTDEEDIGTAIILSDGAGATLIEKEKTSTYTKIYVPHIKAEEDKEDMLTYQYGKKLYMNGKVVYKYAVTKTVENINELLEKSNISLQDVKYIVAHQSNLKIMKAIASRLHIDMKKMYTNIQKRGNTFCASIPIALYDMQKNGLLKTGDKIILLGYGGGLNTGSILMEI